MIQSVTIRNFKSYAEATLELSPLTLLVGANASGKSNAIEAIRLMSLIAFGTRLDSIGKRVHEGQVDFRGQVRDLFRDVTDGLSIGCTIGEVGEWDHFEVTLALRDKALCITREEITSPTQNFPLYRVEKPAHGVSHDMEIAYNNFARGGKKPRVVANDQLGVLTQLETPARFDKSHAKAQQVIPTTVRRFREILGNIQFLDPEPSRMRDYSDTFTDKLLSDGSNASGVLYNLCADSAVRARVLEFIRSLPEQDIARIDFVETPRNEVMLKLTETFGPGSENRDATVLSDGTLRVLAVAAALLSAPRGSLLVIEEIDNGVHPSRADKVLQNVQEVAKERGLSVILSSHNPALLDALPREAVPNVVFCYRDPSEGDSRLVRLDRLKDYPDLVAQGALGTLLTRGILERFVKRPKSEELKREQAQELLELFKE